MNTDHGGIAAVITERRQAAPPAVHQDRAEAVANLAALGMIDPTQGVVPQDVVVGFDVTIGGVTLPALAVGYEVVSTESGPHLTITVPVDAVTVGVGTQTPGQPVQPRPGQKAAGPVKVWQPQGRDPRADIPGWTAEQVEVPDRG